jgi:HEPN domain-containing protein
MSDKDAPNSNIAMFLPALVCAAFSVEVGLKAILMKEGKKGSGHDLLALFKRLPIDSKIEIIQIVGMEPELFYAHLRQAKDAFKDWRYVYEETGEKTVNLDYVARLASAVVQVAESTKPAT